MWVWVGVGVGGGGGVHGRMCAHWSVKGSYFEKPSIPIVSLSKLNARFAGSVERAAC